MSQAYVDDRDRLRREYARRQARPDSRYSPFNAAHLYIIQQRQKALLELLQSEGLAPLGGRRILELGCGSGGVLHEFLGFGATAQQLHGVELLRWRLEQAAALVPRARLINADGSRLPYAGQRFDLVMQFTVFSSVLDDRLRSELAAEMLRVLRPGGLLLWYDYWINPFNRQARGMRPAEVRRLFPGCSYRFRRITLAPPIARLLAPRSWLACYLLERLRLLNTHYLIAIRPTL